MPSHEEIPEGMVTAASEEVDMIAGWRVSIYSTLISIESVDTRGFETRLASII